MPELVVPSRFCGPPASGNGGYVCGRVAGYVDGTKQTLDVCCFELDNRVVIDALVRAARRGVRVRLVTETDYLAEVGVSDLKAAGVPVVDDRRDGALMHNKFFLFSRTGARDDVVVQSSANLTTTDRVKAWNNAVTFSDQRLYRAYGRYFSALAARRRGSGRETRSGRVQLCVA